MAFNIGDIVGYTNVYELEEGNKGRYLWGSGWGVSDIPFSKNEDETKYVMKPNTNTYTDNPGDPYWSNGGGDGNKWVETNVFKNIDVVDNNIEDLSKNFSCTISSYNLDSRYTVYMFIKVLRPTDYNVVIQDKIQISETGDFSVNSGNFKNELNIGDVFQYGFTMEGINANPETDWGSVTIDIDSITYKEHPDSGPNPEPETKPLLLFKDFFTNKYGIGFSVDGGDTNDSYIDNTDRIDDALDKIIKYGFNLLRTWNITDFSHETSFTHNFLSRVQTKNLDLSEKDKIKVQLGIWLEYNNQGEYEKKINDAINYYNNYSDVVFGVSLGNEQLSWPSSGINLTMQNIQSHINYFKSQNTTIPITYTFAERAFNERQDKPSFQNLFKSLDYFNCNIYSFHSNRENSDYTPEEQVTYVTNKGNEIKSWINNLGGNNGEKPFILSETGWQSDAIKNKYPAASDTKLSKYYSLINNVVYNTDTAFDSMFYFNLTDESWKGDDNHWGVFYQGDENSIGDAKFEPYVANKLITNLASGWNMVGFNNSGFIIPDLYTNIEAVYYFNRDVSDPINDNKYITILNDNGQYQVLSSKGYWVKISLSNGETSGILKLFSN